MKKMIAIVKDKESKEIIKIESEYNSISEFRNDLNRNGYQVVGRIDVEGDNSKRKQMYEKGFKCF